MAKKQKSFAEKASSNDGKEIVHVKYVKSVPSQRKGFWRFNESMIAMEKGQSLDAVLKQIKDEENLVDIVMPLSEEAKAEEVPAEEAKAEEAPAEEAKAEEAPAEEAKAEEAPAEEDKA